MGEPGARPTSSSCPPRTHCTGPACNNNMFDIMVCCHSRRERENWRANKEPFFGAERYSGEQWKSNGFKAKECKYRAARISSESGGGSESAVKKGREERRVKFDRWVAGQSPSVTLRFLHGWGTMMERRLGRMRRCWEICLPRFKGRCSVKVVEHTFPFSRRKYNPYLQHDRN